MHELKIAEELSAIVLEAAEKEHLTKVTQVNIRFGRLVQIVPDIFRFAFSSAVRGSAAENAVVNIEVVPVRMKCRGCGIDFQIDDDRFMCDSCGSSDIEITEGKELFVKSIEGE